MTVADMPIAEIRATHRETGDGLHLVARNYKKGVRLDTHMHREAQLVYAAKGTMQVTTPKGRWLVPPDRAVWVPFVVRVSPLLHQAILALFDPRNTPERTQLLVKLAMLELHQAEDSATFIPLPHEPRCRRAADIVLRAPAASHEIERLAQKVGTSARTLSRLFSSETQLSFKTWCQRARIAAAIERLSMGKNVSVKKLAADLGYASVPAFSHAFRQVTGKTPTEFVDMK